MPKEVSPADEQKPWGRVGVGVVLLAAGESTRMAAPKQLLEWRGMPLVQYQVREAQAAAEEIVVVVGHRASQVRPLAEQALDKRRGCVVLNRAYRKGKTTSIKAGLRALRSDVSAVMVLAVDQPRSREVLRALIEGHVRGKHLISVPAYRGKHGHPPVFDRSLLPELLRISEERQGVREVIERHRAALREVAFDSPLVVTNLNTPEDYQRAKALR